jgi:hypothetical protein
MKSAFFLVLIFSFLLLPLAQANIGTDWNSRDNGSNYSSIPVPSINYSPIPYPSMPKFPEITITIPVINWNITIPDPTKITNFFNDFVYYILTWIEVSILNFLLIIIQAFYLVFAYIEYYTLQAVITVSRQAGIFALPVMIMLIILIGIIVRFLLGFAKDITIVGAV